MLGDLEYFRRRTKTHHIAETRERGADLVRHAHAAADANVVTGDCAVLDDGDEAQIMGENIDVVLRRNCQRDLEFPREIGAPVEGFLAVGRRPRRRLEKHLAVRAGTRQKPGADARRQSADFGMGGRLQRIGGAYHIAIDVAAGCDRVEAGPANALYVRTQVAFRDVVELEGLAGRQAQRVARVALRERVERQPLRGRAHAAGEPHAHHEFVFRFEFRAPPFVALLPVILLVDAEEFRQQRIRRADGAGDRINEARRERAAQESAVVLYLLVGMLVRQRTQPRDDV